MSTTTTYTDAVACAPRAGTLYDVIEIILDRGMVIDVFVRVSLVGIEILKVDIRIVIASVDTYLRFAEACNRLDLEQDTRSRTVPELFGGDAMKAAGKKGAKKAVRSAGGKVKSAIPEMDAEEADGEEEEEKEAVPRRRSTGKKARSSSRSRRSEED
jgi:hypothetical protein